MDAEMTAPERIYAHEAVDNGPCDGWDFEGTWHVDVGANGGIEYIRADIHAALQAENERLREALGRIAMTKYGLQGIMEDYEGERYEIEAKNYYANLCQSYESLARAALK